MPALTHWITPPRLGRGPAATSGGATVSAMARVVRLGELDTVHVAGVNWRPVRRALGISAFGINAYSADRGERLIEEHDERGGGAGGHQELYVILDGHAKFTVDGEEIDATAGTLVFVPEPGSRRTAIAVANGTTALVVGGPAGTIAPSAWEHYFAALPLAQAGEPARAYELASAGLTDHPDHPSLHYNLACYASLAGDTDRALEHLARAFEGDPRTRDWAETDSDLDPIRSDPRYPG
jgi:tetratricopeptide (TPR) repeat protein